jgi:hypothetical protein
MVWRNAGWNLGWRGFGPPPPPRMGSYVVAFCRLALEQPGLEIEALAQC